MVANDNLVADIEQWLASKGVTLWADWYIEDPVQRHAAAEWFASSIQQFNTHRVETARKNFVNELIEVDTGRSVLLRQSGGFDVT